MASRRWLLLVGLIAAVIGAYDPAVAEACGGCMRSERVGPERQPALVRERALLIHDADRAREHLIRELAFVQADEPFGLLVPIPTMPEVAALATSPFAALGERFSLEPPGRDDRAQPARGTAHAGVELLEVGELGSLTAFVLAANDAAALGSWLATHEFARDSLSEAWLAHYVGLGFYFVALRYEPPASGDELGPEIVTETVRISFATPIAYYPYFEPVRERRAVAQRELELWVVANEALAPVALRAREQDAWVQPLRRGPVTRDARAELEVALADELEPLLPSGALQVHSYVDRKRSRAGFGDILFAFADGRELTAQLRAELRPLLGLLDPALVESGEGARR